MRKNHILIISVLAFVLLFLPVMKSNAAEIVNIYEDYMSTEFDKFPYHLVVKNSEGSYLTLFADSEIIFNTSNNRFRSLQGSYQAGYKTMKIENYSLVVDPDGASKTSSNTVGVSFNTLGVDETYNQIVYSSFDVYNQTTSNTGSPMKGDTIVFAKADNPEPVPIPDPDTGSDVVTAVPVANVVPIDKEYIESCVPEGYYYLVFEWLHSGTEEAGNANYLYVLLYSETPISYSPTDYRFYANAGGSGSGTFGSQTFKLVDGTLTPLEQTGWYGMSTLPVRGSSFSVVTPSGYNNVFTRILCANSNVYVTSDNTSNGYVNSSTVFFYQTKTTLVQVAYQAATRKILLGQMLGILPLLTICLVGCLAFWKGWSHLLKILRTA